ncbi:MAG: hypothetical protein HY885_15350 [Deltaproteobacteria bacterium]|nr:hypothetical protein [Deltaproteobacteria bacterium]
MGNEVKSGKEEAVLHELAAALAEFAGMQREHGAMLAGNRLKTLAGWVERRQQVFLRLRQCLERFDPSVVPGDSELTVLIHERMRDILHGEQSLAAQVGQQREAIQGQLRILRKGKVVVKGYSLYGGAGPRPKYLSNRT